MTNSHQYRRMLLIAALHPAALGLSTPGTSAPRRKAPKMYTDLLPGSRVVELGTKNRPMTHSQARAERRGINWRAGQPRVAA